LDGDRSGGGGQHGRDPKRTGQGAKAWNPSTGESRYPQGTGEGGEEDEEEVSGEEAAGTWFPPEDDVIWVDDCERFMPDADYVRHFPSAKEDGSGSGSGQKVSDPESGEIASSFEQARYRNFEYQYVDWTDLVPCHETYIQHLNDDGSVDRTCSTGIPCFCKPPCINEQSISTMRDLDFRSSMENVRVAWIHGASIEDQLFETSMLATAFALLKKNVDIVKWVECRLTGEDRITSYLKGKKNWNQEIKLTGKSKEASGTFRAKLFHRLYIFQGNRWADYVNAWMMPGSHDPDIDRATVALELSATLLHELVHSVRYLQSDDDTQKNCRYSYLIENMYRWAMYKRYPEAIASCSVLAPKFDGTGGDSVDSLWGKDDSVWLAKHESPPVIVANPRRVTPCPGSVVVPFDWISDGELTDILEQL
jgi:hypothetical protein